MKLFSWAKLRLFIIRYWPLVLFFGLIFSIFLTNTVHESYPDEFDDILGGWYMLHGKFLYSGFFTHHNPFGYILSAVIELFSLQSFVRFRLVYAIVLFAYMLWTYLFLQRKFPERNFTYYLFVILLFAIGATYFWGHMLLADNVSALLLLPVFALLFLRGFYKEKLLFSDMVMVSIFSSLVFLTAATYVYLLVAVYAYALYLYFIDRRKMIISIHSVKILGLFALPYVVFGIYLLLTGAIKDYYYQDLVFNPKFYIYNYPRPEGASVNPIRYAIIIAQDFQMNFSSLLLGVKDFNFYFPFNMAMAVADTGLAIYLFLKKRYMLLLFLVLVITYANVRTNVLSSKETDYQSSMYFILTFFNMGFVLKQLYEDVEKHAENLPNKIIFSFLLLIIGVYSFFNLTFLIRKYTEKTYNKYMGTQALIYDRPNVAPLINKITSPNDIVWIGPFAFEELFYTNRRVPSKYIILLPEFGRFPHIRDEMLVDFQKNKPIVMYFDTTYSIRGYMPGEYGGFFLDYLKQNYTRLLDYKQGNTKYVSVNSPTEKLDIEAKLYMRNDSRDEIIQKLLALNLIKKETVALPHEKK